MTNSGKAGSGRVGRPRKDPNAVKSERRYNLALQTNDFNDVKKIAEEKGTSFLHVVQQFVQVGVIIYNAVKHDNSEVIIRKKGEDGEDPEDKQLLIL